MGKYKRSKRGDPEPSAWEKAKEFAKNVPKPKVAKNPAELKI